MVGIYLAPGNGKVEFIVEAVGAEKNISLESTYWKSTMGKQKISRETSPTS
jgi:hypothetical protein